ncbi:MAG: hypothetical protein H7234_09620 [Herminiimonas sp.]|nr:hypothetical protein [Herminiimonas sp.]
MTNQPRFALLRIVVLVSLALRCGTGDAVGLGPLRLQSALGQPLRATVQVLGSDAGTLAESCIRISLKMPDGADIVRPQFELRRSKTATTELAISTARTVDEPAVALLVEITCAPTLHRDYQLLLDLRDGLPRVVSNMADELKQETPARNANRLLSDGGESGSARPRKRSRRSQTDGMRSVATAELETMSADDASKPPVIRTKAAPVSRSVLKLTQSDTLGGAALQSVSRQPAGLKFSQSLAITVDPVRLDSEELSAAKARFQAVLRGEDALIAARKELKALQARTVPATSNRPPSAAGQPEAGPAAPMQSTPTAMPQPAPAGLTPGLPDAQKAPADPAAQPMAARPSAAGESRGMLASSSMLLGMALLMAAGLAMVWRHLRGSKRKEAKVAGKNSPWWLAAGDDPGREAELLESARASVTRKHTAETGLPVGGAGPDYRPDHTPERHVNHFVGKHDTASHDSDARIEPVGPAVAVEQEAAASGMAPVRVAAAKAKQLDQASSDPSQFDDAPRDLARSKLATFELVSDVMQEAEFWKMLNETQRAIDILENYCNSAASASPAPWLYLADLYEGLGDGERRAQLCNRFREIFNGRLHEADANTPPGRETLEGYPHLMEKISALWGREAVVPFLQGLLVNDRDSPREGFYLPVYQEILLLIDVALEREQAVA